MGAEGVGGRWGHVFLVRILLSRTRAFTTRLVWIVFSCEHQFLFPSVLFHRRVTLDSAYPLSLVEIVEDLEDNSTQQKDFLFTNPGVVGELDTTDSGISQGTNKERSPLTSDIVNSDDEEAAVLGDIFFLAGRV